MAEYIEREALRNSAESIDWYSVYKGKLTAGAPNTENALYKASSIYAIIDNAPAADVALVRHGKWVDNGIPDSILSGCSVCGFTCGSSSFSYCPNCGCKMDRGDGNSDICSKTI